MLEAKRLGFVLVDHAKLGRDEEDAVGFGEEVGLAAASIIWTPPPLLLLFRNITDVVEVSNRHRKQHHSQTQHRIALPTKPSQQSLHRNIHYLTTRNYFLQILMPSTATGR